MRRLALALLLLAGCQYHEPVVGPLGVECLPGIPEWDEARCLFVRGQSFAEERQLPDDEPPEMTGGP